MQLSFLITEKDEVEKIALLEESLLLFNKPGTFSGKDSLEIEYDKQFSEMCIFIAHKLHIKAEELTVLDFYNAIEYMKNLSKKDG